MKLRDLTVSNVLGARQAVIKPRAPVVLVAGRNGAGKSSLRDAVALAMSGTPSRITLKKEFDQLVTSGAKAGAIEITFEDGRKSVVSLPSGEVKFYGAMAEEQDKARAALPYVLDMARFGEADTDARRQLLFTLTGCSASIDLVRERLLEHKCDPEKIEAVLPLIAADFAAAERDAAERATQAKRDWKAITGETYGEKKATSWSMEPRAGDTSTLPALQAKLAALDEKIGTDQQRIGELAAQYRQHQTHDETVQGLMAQMDHEPRLQRQLEVDREDLAQCEERLQAAERDADRVVTCPCCDQYLRLTANGRLEAISEGEAEREPPEPAPLAEWRRARDMLVTAIANAERNLKAATEARAKLTALESVAVVVSEADVSDARAALEAIKAQRSVLALEISTLQVADRAAKDAEKKTAAAAKHHADVQAWSAIADALAPDGIPGELLAQALKPVNKHLADESVLAEWAVITIDDAMTIRAGGRDYRLLSESEKWRASALITEMISRLSGLKFVLFDRFDVLDNAGRADLLYWLDALAAENSIDTAMVFGTLKKAPAALPDNVCAYWIEGGRTEAVPASTTHQEEKEAA